MGVAQAVVTQQQQDDFVRQHNVGRRTVRPTAANMRLMVWSSQLAAVAQAYGDRCDFTHNSQATAQAKQRNAPFSHVGENLYVTSARGSSTRDSVANNSVISWDNERQFYTYSSRSCQAGKVCGHYTQLAWATSYAVGCGISDCSRITSAGGITRGTLVVCNYGPAGNFRGQSPWVSGAPCSRCPAGVASLCDMGLCSNSTSSGPKRSGTAHLTVSPFLVLSFAVMLSL